MIECFFDGACGPRNPGGMIGTGAVVRENNKILFSHSGFREAYIYNTCNVAEYLGLMEVMNWLIENKRNNDKIVVYGDSKLVIEQMKGNWGIKDGMYYKYAIEAKMKLIYFMQIEFAWIPRERNWLADQLSKEHLNTK